MLKCFHEIKTLISKCIREKKEKIKFKKVLFSILNYFFIPLLIAGVLIFIISKSILGIPNNYFYFIFSFVFLITLLLVVLILFLKKTNINKFFILLPFILLYLFFILSLIFGSYYGKTEFFINDFMGLINPYLMTYGFVLYGGLIGIYIYKNNTKDEKNDSNNVNKILFIMFIYLLVLIGLYFFNLSSNKNLDQKYIEKNIFNNCVQGNKDFIDKNPIGFIDSSLNNYIREYTNIPINKLENLYGKNNDYISSIYYKDGIDCINSDLLEKEKISGFVDIFLFGTQYMNKNEAYGAITDEIKNYYNLKKIEFYNK